MLLKEKNRDLLFFAEWNAADRVHNNADLTFLEGHLLLEYMLESRNVISSILRYQTYFCTMEINLGSPNWQDYISNEYVFTSKKWDWSHGPLSAHSAAIKINWYYTPFHSPPHMVFRVLLLIGKSFDNDQRRKYACFTRAIIHDFFQNPVFCM